jgi:MFS family permease
VGEHQVLAVQREPRQARTAKLTRYQVAVVAILAFLQFTVVIDFTIMSPLGAILMRDLGVSAGRFGFVVSAYAFSAGVSGLLAAGFADEFDRKRLLLFFYGGFVVGTTLCGIVPTCTLLIGARAVTGMFGGVIGSISLAIVADVFPIEVRGRVMGVVATAFAASQVLGIALGLYAATAWGWHAHRASHPAPPASLGPSSSTEGSSLSLAETSLETSAVPESVASRSTFPVSVVYGATSALPIAFRSSAPSTSPEVPPTWNASKGNASRHPALEAQAAPTIVHKLTWRLRSSLIIPRIVARSGGRTFRPTCQASPNV